MSVSFVIFFSPKKGEVSQTFSCHFGSEKVTLIYDYVPISSIDSLLIFFIPFPGGSCFHCLILLPVISYHSYLHWIICFKKNPEAHPYDENYAGDKSYFRFEKTSTAILGKSHLLLTHISSSSRAHLDRRHVFHIPQFLLYFSGQGLSWSPRVMVIWPSMLELNGQSHHIRGHWWCRKRQISACLNEKGQR